MPASETIDPVLDAFLHEQRARLSERTYRNYEDVIRLLRDSLNVRIFVVERRRSEALAEGV